jgi:hypothetical protein
MDNASEYQKKEPAHLPGDPQRLDHPPIAYCMGFGVAALALLVLSGVLYHLSFSHHGPQLLKSLKEKYNETRKSEILETARRMDEEEIHRRFHHSVASPRLPETDRSICLICHSEYPHGRNKTIRGYLNMHTAYLACETCHFQPVPDALVDFRWYHPGDDNPRGPFPGTGYEPETGFLAEAEDGLLKIAPFFLKSGQAAPAVRLKDAPMAHDYLRVRDRLTPDQREGQKNRFHADIRPKGPDCKGCHAKNGILNFKRLGFAEDRISRLEQLNIAEPPIGHTEFYLPDLLKETP